MGKSFSADVIDRIVAASTFDAMKKSKSSNPDLNKADTPAHSVDTSNNKSFFRKGRVRCVNSGFTWSFFLDGILVVGSNSIILAPKVSQQQQQQQQIIKSNWVWNTDTITK